MSLFHNHRFVVSSHYPRFVFNVLNGNRLSKLILCMQFSGSISQNIRCLISNHIMIMLIAIWQFRSIFDPIFLEVFALIAIWLLIRQIYLAKAIWKSLWHKPPWKIYVHSPSFARHCRFKVYLFRKGLTSTQTYWFYDDWNETTENVVWTSGRINASQTEKRKHLRAYHPEDFQS